MITERLVKLSTTNYLLLNKKLKTKFKMIVLTCILLLSSTIEGLTFNAESGK